MKMMFTARAMNRMAGGVQRMVVTIMNAMVARGHEVSLFSWDMAGAQTFFPMAPEIVWHKLDVGDPARKASPREVLARTSVVRRCVRKSAPSVIICFQGGAFRAMQIYTAGMGIPLVAAERNAPTRYEHANTAFDHFLELAAFRFAKGITVQFERYRALYPHYLWNQMVTIPNPVAVATKHARPNIPTPDGRYTLLAVGRLSYQKNFDVLLRAFTELAPRFAQWDLRIVGEGADRLKLEALVDQTPSLAHRVSLPGTSTDMPVEYAAAHLFCLPSRWEGFPNVLAEALAHGLPSIGFAGCAGASDLIADGRTGLVASGNNEYAPLAKALASLMEAPDRRAEMGRDAIAAMVQYQPDRIFDLWEKAICSWAAK